MRRQTITAGDLSMRGWMRADPKPWRTKLSARYEHVDGWVIEHCGHPTAHHPWMLLDPKGRMVLTGLLGPFRCPHYGTAWDTLEQATSFVLSLDRHERENGPRALDAHAPKAVPA